MCSFLVQSYSDPLNAVPTPTETSFDWQQLVEESHLLVIEGSALNNPQGIIHATRNLLKFQAHLVEAIAHLAGQAMPHMPRLEPMQFRHGQEMPLDNSWEAEVWPEQAEANDDAA